MHILSANARTKLSEFSFKIRGLANAKTKFDAHNWCYAYALNF